MFLLVLFGVSLASVVVAGGSLNRLSSIRFRHTWTAVAGLLLQILIISLIPQSNPMLLAGGHVLSYVLIGAFVFLNRSQPGLWLLGLGWGCNLLAIVANGGVMPVAASAAASVAAASHRFENSRAIGHPKLLFLGDIFAMPRSWPLHNIFSIGDVLIVLGAFVLLHSVCRTRLARFFGARRRKDSLSAQEVAPG